MIRAVIDTNVLLVANEQHADVSTECVTECVRRLQAMEKTGVTVIDDGFRILGEYQNKTSLNPPKGVGDVFLKWLLRQAGNPTRVEQISLTELAENEFAEFRIQPCNLRLMHPIANSRQSLTLILISHLYGRQQTANGWTGGQPCRPRGFVWNFSAPRMLAGFIAISSPANHCLHCRTEPWPTSSAFPIRRT